MINYRLRQSFVPSESTPEEVNRLGCGLAWRFTKGNTPSLSAHTLIENTSITTSFIPIHTVSYHQSYDPKKSLLFQDLTMTYVLLQWLLLSYSLRKYASLPPLICSV